MIALGAIVMCGWRLNWQRLPVLCHGMSVCVYMRVVSISRPDKVEAAWSEVCNQRWGRGISSFLAPLTSTGQCRELLVVGGRQRASTGEYVPGT